MVSWRVLDNYYNYVIPYVIFEAGVKIERINLGIGYWYITRHWSLHDLHTEGRGPRLCKLHGDRIKWFYIIDQLVPWAMWP